MMDVSNSTMPDISPMTTEDPLDGYPFPSKYPWWHIIAASVTVTFIIAIIVLGNALVIVAIVKDNNLKQLQNWFIASLAVSDLLLGLLIMPFSLANELMGYWYFGQLLCEMWLSIDVLLCTASILNLCLISLDRYWSITRAVSYVKHRTKKKATLMITVVWVLSAIICFPPLVGWKRPQPKSKFPQCQLSSEIGYVVYSTLGSFFIPLMVMVVVYFKIYLAARARARRHLNKNKTKAAAAAAAKKKQQSLNQNSSNNGKALTLTNATATTHVNTSFTKLSPSGGVSLGGATDASRDSPDVASLSASESCQEAASIGNAEEGTTVNDNKAIINLHSLERGGVKYEEGHQTGNRKTAGNPLQGPQRCACNKSGSGAAGTIEEQRKLLADDTDRTESDSEFVAPPSNGFNLQHKQYANGTHHNTATELLHVSIDEPGPHNRSSVEMDTVAATERVSVTVTGCDQPQNGATHSCVSNSAETPSVVYDCNVSANSTVIGNHMNVERHCYSSSGDCGKINGRAIMEVNHVSKMADTNNTSHVTHLKTIDTYTTDDNVGKSPTASETELEPLNSKKNLLAPNPCSPKTNPPLSPKGGSHPPKSKKRTKDLRKAANEPERLKRKIARARERRATLVLGIIMATFILCWLPFFGTYLISTLAKFELPGAVFAIMFWAGYCNSALNPIIYTIFNQDFRKAFQKLIFGRRYR